MLIAFLAIAFVSVALFPMAVSAQSDADEFSESREQTPDDDDDDGDQDRDTGASLDDGQRQSLASMNRDELEAEGFSFEDPLDQQHRAHSTLFALLPGTLVTGAGHWYLGDSRTALSLVIADSVGLAMLGTGLALTLRPTGQTAIDERRYELFFLGAGTLASTWLIDIFGTAFRDDLGIPESTAHYGGWGMGLNYHYLRPRGRSLRHVADLTTAWRGRRLRMSARTAQELGLGMSDYELSGRWDPFVGTSRDTRVGMEFGGRFVDYRLDEPFQRLSATARVHMALNLGRLFTHLDHMLVGAHVGLSLRGYRFIVADDDFGALGYGGWMIPLRLYLALNLTEQLRLTAAFERGQGQWLQTTRRLWGTPSMELTYRSTDRVGLRFFGELGHGFQVGAGMQLWFGE